jgi:hypothetical protein
LIALLPECVDEDARRCTSRNLTQLPFKPRSNATLPAQDGKRRPDPGQAPRAPGCPIPPYARRHQWGRRIPVEAAVDHLNRLRAGAGAGRQRVTGARCSESQVLMRASFVLDDWFCKATVGAGVPRHITRRWTARVESFWPGGWRGGVVLQRGARAEALGALYHPCRDRSASPSNVGRDQWSPRRPKQRACESPFSSAGPISVRLIPDRLDQRVDAASGIPPACWVGGFEALPKRAGGGAGPPIGGVTKGASRVRGRERSPLCD